MCGFVYLYNCALPLSLPSTMNLLLGEKPRLNTCPREVREEGQLENTVMEERWTCRWRRRESSEGCCCTREWEREREREREREGGREGVREGSGGRETVPVLLHSSSSWMKLPTPR